MSKNRESFSAEDVSILSNGIKIEGNIFSEGNVRIDGKVTGDVIANGHVTLGENSVIKGEIKAKNITVSGRIEGALNSTEKIVLESNSVIIGDISTKILVIEAGSKFNGNSRMEQSSAPVTQENHGERR
ncbi:MAG: polymer-forming cytoskeletal protein [Melioribacteraceae bacterium]|nr:polymer-forming cytoskeletal protein [Melioribacteraceae bacterium]